MQCRLFFFSNIKSLIFLVPLLKSVSFLEEIIGIFNLLSFVQVLTMVGDFSNALKDLDALLEIDDTSHQKYYDRGKVKFFLKRFGAAYDDLLHAKELMYTSGDHEEGKKQHILKPFEAKLWHLIGKCEKEFGDTAKALRSFRRARDADPAAKESDLALIIMDSAATLMEASLWKESLDLIDEALKYDPKLKNAYGYRGLLNQNLGRHKHAIEDFKQALAIDPSDTQCLFLSAVCHHAIANYSGSRRMFDRLLAVDPTHGPGYFRREVMLYSEFSANVTLTTFNPDVELSPLIREGTIKPIFPGANTAKKMSQTARKAYKSNKVTVNGESLSQTATTHSLSSGEELFVNEAAGRKSNFTGLVNVLMEVTKAFSQWIQLDTPGFLPNSRHHTAFGLGVLQMAQSLCDHIRAIQKESPGLIAPDSAASAVNFEGFVSSEECKRDMGEFSFLCRHGHHIFGWRDFFDIFVRWRQVGR